jgi:serine/threonine protein kinase/Tfp pilus assembly protein PilF
MGDSANQAKSIFLAAIEDHVPEQWPAFVEQACAGDVRLRAEVERLLRAQSEMGSFHEMPRSARLVPGQAAFNEGPGTVIGPYKLLEQIGEGGFGVVYMAEQQHPVRRKVALKVLKPGLDTKQVVARFEAERQALALMDHPHVAHVLDAGATDAGRPYFVMELIRGIPITQFCDDNRLTPRERLELFATVCQAVQHAHQKGIIHRDLKPSNVPVTLLDGTPVVKVIDFGIAKALGQERLTDKTLFTGFAQRIGTPLYMSPEHAEMSGQDVDTRTDIYGLGVLLYELLTRTTPFHKERLQDASYDEIRRILREEEPAKPSTRISTLGQAATTVSANRKSEPRRLSQLFRRELDWIVMKALEKDRNRRYDTASAFAADVQRYLDDEPEQACPPTLAQRAAKWSRRHRSVVWAAVLLMFMAFLGSGIATLLIARERDAVNANYRMAQDNLDTAYQVLDIFVENAEQILPREKEPTLKHRRLLQQALTFYEQIAHQHSSEPSLPLKVAQAYGRAGRLRERLGQAEEAREAYRQAVAVSLRLATDFPNEPDYRQNLARSYASFGSMEASFFVPGRRPELEQTYADALRLQEHLVQEFPGNLEYLHDLAWTYAHLGYMRLFGGAGPPTEAEEPVRRALEIREGLVEAKPTEFHYRQERGESLGNFGNLLCTTGRFEQAEGIVRRELEVRQKVSDDFPAEPDSHRCLADAYRDVAGLRKSTGRLQEAIAAYRQELPIRKQLAAEFPNRLPYQGNAACCHLLLGDALRRIGAQEEAMSAYEEVMAVCKEILRFHPECAEAYIFWGRALARTGARNEAVRVWEQAVQQSRGKATVVGFVAGYLVRSLDLRTESAEAAVQLAHAIQLAQQAVTLEPQNSGFWTTLGTAYYRAGKWRDAVAGLEKAMQLGGAGGGAGTDLFFLAMAHRQIGQRDKARECYGKAVQWMNKNNPYDEYLCRIRAEAATLLGSAEATLK